MDFSAHKKLERWLQLKTSIVATSISLKTRYKPDTNVQKFQIKKPDIY